ncbi:MAG: protein-L-isoaspartate(D-aspartate) O-methyltransferase, partial [bacterium]
TPREAFVDKRYLAYAYEDRALPTLLGQTISQPSLVALTLQELSLKPTDVILEIGTGSGFQTALLSQLVKKVYSVELLPQLAKIAEIRLKRLRNIELITGDGSLGWLTGSPYDAIIVTAAFTQVPDPLSAQLRTGGKLIMPIGKAEWQELMLYQKLNDGLVALRKISDVHFVPLLGKYAYMAR